MANKRCVRRNAQNVTVATKGPSIFYQHLQTIRKQGERTLILQRESEGEGENEGNEK